MAKEGHPTTGIGADTPGPTSTRENRPPPPPYVTVEAHSPSPPLDTSELHPLMTAAYYNKTKSPLCRLPEAVLIRLMQLCDNVTIECLRRSSRIFLYLFHTTYSSGASYTYTTQHLERYPWPMSTFSSRYLPGELTTFLGLMDRDQLCQDCIDAKTAVNWQSRVAALVDTYLHCSGCRADHAACLFSASERTKPQSQRVCIGHEGHIRLCSHVGVPWSAIVSEAAKRRQLETETERGRGMLLKRCQKDDHMHPSSRPRFVDLFFRRQQKSLDYRDTFRSPLYPILATRFAKPPGSDKFTFRVTLKWSSHVPLTMRKDGRFEAKEFAQEIEARYRRQGRFICPETSPGQNVGRILCDPVRCDCVVYAGKESFDWKRPLKSWVKAEVCRTTPNSGLIHRLTLPWGGRITCCSRWHMPEKNYFNWAGVHRCKGGPDGIVLTYYSTFRFTLDEDQRLKGMDTAWYAALDPESYKVFEDTDGLGVYWCKSEGCRNYYLFAQSRLGRLLKDGKGYWRECSQLDENKMR